MSGPEIAMSVGDVVAVASLAISWLVSRNTKRRLDAAKYCPSCWGRSAGYDHEPDCTRSDARK